MKKKKKLWIRAIIIPLIIFIILAVFRLYSGMNKDEVAVINGSPIYAEELQKEMDATRHQVLGESPDVMNNPKAAEQWKQTALENCIRRQLIFQLAKREGLMETTDYRELILQMEQENKTRAEADKRGEVVYGILSYTEETYFTYLLSNITPKLITALIDKELKFEENDIKTYFEDYKIGEQLKPGYHSIVMYSAESAQSERKEELQTIKKELEKGKLPEDITTGEDIASTSVDVSSDSRIAQRSLLMQEHIFSLKEGETSEVFEDGEQFVLLYCTAIAEESKITYEESRQYTRNLYLEQSFEELLKQLRESAEVTLNKRAFQAVG